MKRFLSVLAVSALFVALAAVAVAQDAKDKGTPPKDKDKAQPTKEKSDKDTPPAKAPVTEAPKMELSAYYPLRVGSMWHYRIGDNRYTLKVTKYEKIGDLNCARVEQLVEEGKVIAVEHIAVTKEGIVRVAYDDKKSEPPLLFLKLPVKKDETWKVDSVIGKTDKVPGERVTATFKEGEVAKVMVPAGTTEGVITSSSQDLDANGQKLSFTYYFGKNVGLIKQEIDVNGTRVTIELEKYEPAKE
jgi:hypothetical protein